MHHGPVFLHQFFGDVLNTCLSFLKKNSSEFIIISVKKEHSTENSKMDFPEVMREKYIRPHEKYFFTENRIPKLHEIRGKIVLLRRYGGTFLGINALPWKDNATFVVENGGFNIHVQDEYDKYTALTIISKRKPVAHLVKASMSGRSIDMYINFTSLSGALTPYNGA